MDIVLLDSITDVRPGDHGKIAVSGSHGGTYAATVASRAGLRAVVLNDAGRGQGDAGIAGLMALDKVGMAGMAVSANSAEIGSAADARDNGIISYANQAAQSLGVIEGQAIAAEFHKLESATQPEEKLAPVAEARWEQRVNGITVLCVDSAALVTPDDAGRIIVTGSHGGLIGGDPARACKANAKLVVFNDAGGGKNGIGFTRLPALQARQIASLTVDCMSCRIGDAASNLETGIISAVNQAAADRGFIMGRALATSLGGADGTG